MGGARSTRCVHIDGPSARPKKMSGLKRQQETYISQLRELQKSKPRGQVEENLTLEMSRLESALTLARDDLVSLLVSSLA